MNLKKVFSLILAAAMVLSFLPGGIVPVHAVDAENIYQEGYTWAFDKTYEKFANTDGYKKLIYGNSAGTVRIVGHSAYANYGSRSLKNGVLTTVFTSSWAQGASGVYYQLPAELVVGQEYEVSMNLYASETETPLVNGGSSSVKLSFVEALPENYNDKAWNAAQIEGLHNANATVTYPAPTNLSTDATNKLTLTFVATQAMADSDGWMLISFPLAVNKEVNLGSITMKASNYKDGYTWAFDKTVDAFGKTDEFKKLYYGNGANTIGIVNSENNAANGSRSLKNGVLTTVITKDADWARGANGVYYKLPAGLVVGQEYVITMNLYASAEGTSLTNNKSTAIKLSFANEPTSANYWTVAQIEPMHNAATLLSYRAPDYLSTSTANKLSISFVATQAMADNDGWMLITFPLAANKEVNLGSLTMEEKKDTTNHFLNGDFSDGLTGWLTNFDSSFVSVKDSVLDVSNKVPTGDVKLYQAMYLEAGTYRLSFDVLGNPTSWRPVYFMGNALDNSAVTGSQLQVAKESGKTADGWWTVTRDVTIETAGTYYFQMNLNQVSGGASVAPAMQYDNFQLRKLVTVTWNNADGSQLKTEQIGQGTVPAYTGEIPTKAADANGSYVFAGWNPALTAVTEDTTFTAVFNNVAHEDKDPADHKCDSCGFELGTCADKTGDSDHNCDVCGKKLAEHTFVSGSCECGATVSAVVDGVEYDSLQDAVNAAVTSGKTLKLTENAAEIVVESGKTLILDLNGKTVEKLIANGTFYGIDTATKDYNNTNYGVIKVIEGNVAPITKVDDGSKAHIYYGYAACQSDEGYSFNYFEIKIASVVLRPTESGIGYKLHLAGNAQVKALLDETNAFGVTVYVEGHENSGKSAAAGSSAFEVGAQTKMVMIKNILASDTAEEDAANGAMKICVKAYIQLGEEKVEISYAQGRSLKDVMESMNDKLGGYDDVQKKALKAMYDNNNMNAEAFKDWKIENIANLPSQDEE